MQEEKTLKLVAMVREGSTAAREEIIRENKTFIARISAKICGRYLCWENDDELSVALIAFNEAIDRFNKAKNSSFHFFAYQIIHQRLVDHFRRENRHYHLAFSLPGEEEKDSSPSDYKQAWEEYQQVSHRENMAEAFKELNSDLSGFGMTLKDVSRSCPKHRDTRETLIRVARMLSENEELLGYLHRCKQLPVKELTSLCGTSRRVLGKGRKYIIALALIMSDKRFHYIKSYIDFS